MYVKNCASLKMKIHKSAEMPVLSAVMQKNKIICCPRTCYQCAHFEIGYSHYEKGVKHFALKSNK
jgi:hypothetical protein